MKRGLIVYDYHDTLVDANRCFSSIADNVIQEFKNIFGESYEFWKTEIIKYYSMNIKQHGYHPGLWSMSMVEIYRDYVDPGNYNRSHILSLLENSDKIFENIPELFDMVSEVLDFMSRDYDQVLMSNFPKNLLIRDLNHHDILKYFKDVKGYRWGKDFESVKLNTGELWSVGDSLSRDIQPAIIQGFNTVYIPYYSISSVFWPEKVFGDYQLYATKHIEHIKYLPEVIYGGL